MEVGSMMVRAPQDAPVVKEINAEITKRTAGMSQYGSQPPTAFATYLPVPRPSSPSISENVQEAMSMHMADTMLFIPWIKAASNCLRDSFPKGTNRPKASTRVTITA